MPLDFNPSYQSADERLAEAERILNILRDQVNFDSYTEKETDFLIDMWRATTCSPAQLNWLRRIKEKYL